MPLPTRIPTLSSQVLEFFFNQRPTDLGSGARDVTELQPPQTQGLNALALAEYIIDNDPKNPYYENAKFFKKQWDSGDCYICGLRINDTGHTMELEHVLPIAEALALTGIIQEKRKIFTNPQNLKEVADTNYAKYYLLEYARSHRCCNQIKSSTSFLSFNLNASNDMEKYTPNLVGINKVLKEIYYQGSGQVKTDGKFQEEKACANRSFRQSLIDYGSNKSIKQGIIDYIGKTKFIENRREFIVTYYINPIIVEINALISSTTFNFAQLVFLANQAMSVDPEIWKTLEGKKMNEVSVDKILSDLFTNSIRLDYKKTRKPIADNLLIFLNKFPLTLYKKAKNYVDSNLSKAGSTVRQSPRNIDLKALVGFLNIDYNFYKKIYFENITKRKDNYNGLTSDNEGLYGFQYMYYLLKNQNPSIKFTKEQIDNLIGMMNNVNDFMILYIYIYIIFYNPFIDLKKDQKDESDKEIDYIKIAFNTGVRELETFNLQLKIEQGMGQIHENYCRNIFSNLNYVIEKLGYTDIRDLENYGIYVAQSTDEIVVAEYLIRIADLITQLNKNNIEKNIEIIEYDKTKHDPEPIDPPTEGMAQILSLTPEEVSITSGGIKLYKKTRKNNYTRRKTKTRKHNYKKIKTKTQKNKKPKTQKNKKLKKKLRYTKKY
jgi:hypothetical protein